jgi:hypothetical protein
MGVSCTLLGHKYGEAEIEREREERGEEAVVTIREVKVCERCGNRSVVSENKEVTAAQPGDAEVAKPADEDAASTDQSASDTPDAPDHVSEEGLAEAADDKDVVGDAETAGEGAADAAEEGPEHDPETDDGVILDDGDDEVPEEREYGEWPDAEEDHASAEADPAAADDGKEPAAWPDSDEDADEGYDATTPDGEPADVEFPGSADGEEVASDEAAGESDDGGAEVLDTEPESAGTESATPADEGADFERAREAGSPSEPGAGGTELYCPACGYRDPSRDGSLREGDICAECRKGYLAARE